MSLIYLKNGLMLDENGIWKGAEQQALSYPAEGHSQCLELEDISFWFRHRNECIVSAIKQHPPKGCILDVGGGNGYVTRRLLDEGLDASLLEPGPEGALNAKLNRHIPEVICTTLEEACFVPESLSAVGCFDVIEHIEDDRDFMEQVHDHLEPGGLFYATVPAHQGLWSLSDVHAHHYRRYNKRTITKLLEYSGFEVEFFTYLFSVLTPFIFLFRTLPFMIGQSKKSNVLSADTEHGSQQGMGSRVMDAFLHSEFRRLKRGGTLNTGASCLVVARKKDIS